MVHLSFACSVQVPHKNWSRCGTSDNCGEKWSSVDCSESSTI